MTLETFIYQQQCSTLVFVIVLVLIMLGNLIGMRRLGHARQAVKLPRVSILVPARNERHNIEVCVNSLLAQDYPDFEVLVLDDGSEDGTWEILERLALQSPRLKVLSGKPLPEGWLGKNWACHQLSLAASGRLLLFTDADTRHHPRTLSDTAALAEATGVDFMSGVPAQITGTWSEKLSASVIPWIIHTFTPVALLRSMPFGSFALAVGQFMLFRRKAYLKVGGHAAVRASVVEDVDLARRVKQLGLRWDLVDVSSRVSTRMYHGFNDLWQGYSKNLFAVFHYNLPLFAFIWSWLLFVAWHPLLTLLMDAAGRPIPGLSSSLALITLLLQLVLWLVSNLRFRSSLMQTVMYPFTILLFVGIGSRSVFLHLARRPTKWKGRDVPARK